MSVLLSVFLCFSLFLIVSGPLTVTAGVFSVLRSNGHKKSLRRSYERH